MICPAMCCENQLSPVQMLISRKMPVLKGLTDFASLLNSHLSYQVLSPPGLVDSTHCMQMTTSDDLRARDFSRHTVGEINDTNYSHWSLHAKQLVYPEATWNLVPDFETKTQTGFEEWKKTSKLPVSLLDSRSPPLPASHNFSHSFQPRYTSINTNLGLYKGTEASPSALSPPSGQFYSNGRYGGSTPLLVSPSLSTPPTGKSAFLPLTPDQGMSTELHLPMTAENWDQLNLKSPSPLYPLETGATPDLTRLNLNSYEEFRFQMARPIQGPGQSSVLLGSNPSFDSSQSSDDLDPLDLDNTLIELGGQASNFTGPTDSLAESNDYSIAIVPAENTGHSVPVKINLDGTDWNTNILLSPLGSLEGLPYEYQVAEETHGVIIRPTSWEYQFSQAISPTPSNPPAISDSQPSPHVRPASNSVSIPASPHPMCHSQTTRFPSYENDASSSARSALEGMHTGQSQIVNPKGVSDRTLAAAEANRKREAKFRCDICGNSQTSKQNLQNHVLSRHMQLKRFLCPIEGCSAKYGHARGVNRHLDSKHPGHRQANTKGKRGPPKRT